MTYKFVSFLFLLILNIIDSGSAIVTIDKETAKMECDVDTPMVVPNFKANWFKATEYCHYLGRHLVIVTSPEKQEVIGKVLEGTDKAGDNSFWIGGSDLAELGNFHWHSTGSRIVWHNWNELSGIPSADDGRKDDRCVLLGDSVEQGGFKWTVVNCWDEYYFVCERGVYA